MGVTRPLKAEDWKAAVDRLSEAEAKKALLDMALFGNVFINEAEGRVVHPTRVLLSDDGTWKEVPDG